MALGVGHNFRMTNFFDQGGNQALMVSYWRLVEYTEPQTDSFFAEAMQRQMMDIGRVHSVMSVTARCYRTVIDNLTIPLEFGEFIGDDFGSITGDPAPSFVTISVKQLVPTRLTRNGYKRIPFPSDTNTAGNDPQVGTSDRLAIEAFFGAEVEINYTSGVTSLSAIVQPLVIGRTNVGTPEDPDYILDLSKIQFVSGAQVSKVTSQNTRKV